MHFRISGEYIKIFSSKEGDKYAISGVDADPFIVESRRDENLCSDKVCGILWLKNGITLDREEKELYSVTRKLHFMAKSWSRVNCRNFAIVQLSLLRFPILKDADSHACKTDKLFKFSPTIPLMRHIQ